MNYYVSDLHLFYESQLDNGGKNYDGRPYKTLDDGEGASLINCFWKFNFNLESVIVLRLTKIYKYNVVNA